MTRSRNDRKNLSLAFTEEREPPGPLPNPPPQVFGDQLAWADLVILNKTDLIDAETLRRLRRRLMQWLRAAIAAPGILRVEGFVNVRDLERRQVVQPAGARVAHHYDRAWHPGEIRTSQLVVIAEKGLDGAAVTAALGG
jgi:G3E family GTPase